jgi:hypothetical protein
VANEYRAPVATGPGVPTAEDSQGTEQGSRPDLSEFESLNSRTGRNRCTVATAADRLTEAERDLYTTALARPFEGADKVEHAAIARWLQKRGIGIAGSTIGRHRLGMCGCGR